MNTPSASTLAAAADDLSHSATDAVREGSRRLQARTAELAESTNTFIHDEPVKSVLIAAAMGAALMALVALASRALSSRH
jgi:ElaB/YqjD/DUF883 family membrane-anchored ribosome-binding protein